MEVSSFGMPIQVNWSLIVTCYAFCYLDTLYLCKYLLHVVSLEPSFTISTRKSFEKIPTSPDKRTPTKPTATAPVTPEPLHASNKSTYFVADIEDMEESQQPYWFISPEFPEYLMIELPSPDELMEYFPVSHVILNNVDWSLTVVNDGLCVMIYSFLPSRPSTTVNVRMYVCSYTLNH